MTNQDNGMSGSLPPQLAGMPPEVVEALRDLVQNTARIAQAVENFVPLLREVGDQLDTFPRVGTIAEPDGELIECAGCDACRPEPLPEWRRLVEFAHTQPCDDEPLACVLLDLSRLANKYAGEPEHCLARIIAVCEAQVGDGWQADAITPRPGTAYELARWLTDASPLPTEHCWKSLGEAAAAWLASLTGEAS